MCLAKFKELRDSMFADLHVFQNIELHLELPDLISIYSGVPRAG